MLGDIQSDSPKSLYKPTKAVADITAAAQRDYATGYEFLTKGWTELNMRSVIEDENRGTRMNNAFVDDSVDDPDEAWKYRGTRSKARNKAFAMQANLTAAFLIPGVRAQNDADEIDRDFSDVMQDILEWMVQPTNSEYQSSFLSLVQGMMESPVTYFGAEWFEVMQEIKERQADGSYTKKEILDEVLSGFKAPVYGATEVLISNPYERNIQKHTFNIPYKWIEYSEAEAKYKDHPNWDFVQKGTVTVFNADDGLFYDIKDDDHPEMVQEVIWKRRRDDSEVPFLGCIYMGDKNVKNNPIKHRDHKGAPKYNVVPFGYNRIGKHFFYYKSMMNVCGWDNDLFDAMSEILMNNAILESDPATIITGEENVDSGINFPGAVLAFANKDVKTDRLFPQKNFVAGFQALMATKESIDEETISGVSEGQLPQASQKAYSVAQSQANAKKILAGVGKSLAESITAYGPLMIDIAMNHLTTAQVDEITAGGTRVKYRSFTLENKTVGGKQVSKQILFDDSLVGQDMTDEEKNSYHLRLLEKVGGPDSRKHIRAVNPYEFSKYKYLAYVDAEEMFPRNAEMMSAVLTNLYQIMGQDPLIEQETLRRELMRSLFRSDGEKFIKKQAPVPPGSDPAMLAEAAGATGGLKKPAAVAGAPLPGVSQPAGVV